jgi:hypothetical protein
MFRRYVLALTALVICSGSLLAEDLSGTIRKVDTARNCIILTVGDQDRTIEVAPKAPVYMLETVGRRRRATTQLQQVGQGLKALQPGMYVTVQTQNREGVEMVTQVREDQGTTTTSGRRLLRRRY